MAKDTGTESGVKWSNKPATGNTIMTFVVEPADVGGTLAIDVPSYVNAQRTTDGRVSFALMQPTNLNSLANFHSRESTLPPKLESN